MEKFDVNRPCILITAKKTEPYKELYNERSDCCTTDFTTGI